MILQQKNLNQSYHRSFAFFGQGYGLLVCSKPTIVVPAPSPASPRRTCRCPACRCRISYRRPASLPRRCCVFYLPPRSLPSPYLPLLIAAAQPAIAVQVRKVINFRGALFLRGHRCFAPLGRYGDPCFGAAPKFCVCSTPAGKWDHIWLNQLCERAIVPWNLTPLAIL